MKQKRGVKMTVSSCVNYVTLNVVSDVIGVGI